MTLIDTVRKSATDLTATATERVTKATEAIDGTPLQAVLGVADTAVQQARTGRAQLETQVAELRKVAAPAELRKLAETQVAELRKVAEARVADANKAVETRVADANKAVETGVATFKTRANKVVAQAQELPNKALAQTVAFASTVTATYENFAGRGQKLITRVSNQKATQDLLAQSENTQARAKAAVTTIKHAAQDLAGTAETSAQTLLSAANDSADKARRSVKAATTSAG